MKTSLLGLLFERYFFQRAITWQTELVTMLLVASTFIGSAYVLSEKAHVSMEWIYDFLSKKNRLDQCVPEKILVKNDTLFS